MICALLNAFILILFFLDKRFCHLYMYLFFCLVVVFDILCYSLNCLFDFEMCGVAKNECEENMFNIKAYPLPPLRIICYGV